MRVQVHVLSASTSLCLSFAGSWILKRVVNKWIFNFHWFNSWNFNGHQSRKFPSESFIEKLHKICKWDAQKSSRTVHETFSIPSQAVDYKFPRNDLWCHDVSYWINKINFSSSSEKPRVSHNMWFSFPLHTNTCASGKSLSRFSTPTPTAHLDRAWIFSFLSWCSVNFHFPTKTAIKLAIFAKKNLCTLLFHFKLKTHWFRSISRRRSPFSDHAARDSVIRKENLQNWSFPSVQVRAPTIFFVFSVH